MKRILKRFIVIGLIFLVICSIVLSISLKLITYKNEINADIYIVEGWIPDECYDQVLDIIGKREDKLILTSGIQLPEYFGLFNNGYLVFDFTKGKVLAIDEVYDIKIYARGEMIKHDSVLMNLWINDAVVYHYAIGAEDTVLTYHCLDIDPIDSIGIQFTNDRLSHNRDMNLFIKEIVINGQHFSSYSKCTHYDKFKWDGINTTYLDYYSYAELAEYQLEKLGFDTTRVISIPGTGSKNRTLNSSIPVVEYLTATYPELDSIVLITTEDHSRRTYITYRHLLNSEIEIGVINLSSNVKQGFFKSKLDEIKEIIHILYYRLFLLR